jgi:lipoate-protein ligase A
MRVLKPDCPVLLLWQTEDTVMIGANQIVDAEIDRSFAESHGIDIVRRSSGGGAIFTDPGTLQYTIIQPYTEGMDTKDVVSSHLAPPVIATLALLGVEAVLEGRNDILVAGKKISGIAQFINSGYLCSHGSLLFAADLDVLARALTVDNEKIVSKALRSIKSRVTNISEHIPTVPISEFWQELLAAWQRQGTGETSHLTESDTTAIQGIMAEKYTHPSWTFGHTPPYTFTNAHRFSGGRLEVFLDVKEGTIQACRITGDFLALRPLDELEAKLIGTPHGKEALYKLFEGSKLEAYLGSITAEELVSVLTP